MDAICQLGCIVCRNEGVSSGPASPHHLLDTGRRINHFHTIPLCHRHHQEGSNTPAWVSRHPWRAEFEKRYGSELELLAQVIALCGTTWEKS